MAEAQVEVTPDNLAELTDRMESDEPASPEAPEPQPEMDEGGTPPESVEAEPADAGGQSDMSDEEKALLEELRAINEVSGTPFKNVKDLVGAYKNLQGEFTKTREKTKPYEAVLDRMSEDQNFAGLVSQLQQMMDNPDMLKAYANQGLPGDPEPNPAQYETWTQEGLGKWQKDHDSWLQRQMDSRFNTLKSDIETRAKLENYEREFKGKFPNVEHPQELLQWAQKQGRTMNPFEAAFKLRNWDTMRSEIEAQVRKELGQKLESAGKTKTPQGTTAKSETTAGEVVKHVSQYGYRAAVKRYGEADVNKALQLSTRD